MYTLLQEHTATAEFGIGAPFLFITGAPAVPVTAPKEM
jgi:hypothetical protein